MPGDAPTTHRRHRSTLDSPEHPINDPRYRLLPPDVLPGSECLKDVVARVLPYWYDVVAPQLLAGLDVLITAHGNSLRALLMHLEHVSPEEIADVNIPTGAPRRTTSTIGWMSRRAGYLGDADAVATAAERRRPAGRHLTHHRDAGPDAADV